jgi:hypothetical protein
MMCEKCWGDAYWRARLDGRPQTEHYQELLKERKDNPCSKSEQLGQWADENGNDVRLKVRP